MKIADNAFDKELKVGEPVVGYQDKWNIPISINIIANKNYENIINQIYSFSKSISLSEVEKDNYLRLGKKVYVLSIKLDTKEVEKFYFRNESVRNSIALNHWHLFSKEVYCTGVTNGVDTLKLSSKLIKNIRFNDSTEKPFITLKFARGESNIFLFSYEHDMWRESTSASAYFVREDLLEIGPLPSYYTRNRGNNNGSVILGDPILPSEDIINNTREDGETILNLLPLSTFFSYTFLYVETLDKLKKIKSYNLVELPHIFKIKAERRGPFFPTRMGPKRP